jgi:SWI/SNF-related matrix-associated actin-dependent regulator 1 of chromatin subfamily A
VWHRATAEYIHDKFKKVSVLTYGGISEKEKDKSKKKFISDPKILLDIRNIGTCPGVDGLQTVCNNVAFVEFPYTESQLEQAEDRIDRVGQKYSVNIHFLAAANTIDQRYAEILDKNSDINNVLLKGGKGQKLTIMEALKEACEKN